MTTLGIIKETVDWDLNGNLWKRQDLKLSPSVTEEFFYDNLNRFDKSERTPAGGITETNADVTLDSIGNITWKQGVGSYTYHATKKRAVTAAGSFSFDYDANGNMTSRNGSSIGYTSYNLPSVINAGTGYSSTLSYGAFRNRYKQIAVTPTTTETTIYVAGLLEKVTRGSSIEYRHLIHGGQGAAAIHTRVVGGASSTYYLHRDHLGSPELITDSSGNEVVRPSFGAFGERRDGTDWSGPPSIADLTDIANISRRGFTGHEHLDSVGLIHMNGRVYEPVAGRFLGVDPIVHIGMSQSPNSYSYVWNNPLTMIDPSGFDGEDVVTEGDSQPRYFPQCPYQIANIAVDCTYRYGWRWSDLRVIDLWLMDEWRVEMWVRSMDARSQPQTVIAPNAQWSDPGPVTDWKLAVRGAGQLVVEGVIGSIPVVGTVVGIYDAITVFSDGDSTNMERTLAVVGVLPGGKWIKVLVRGVGGDVFRAVGRGADDAARGVARMAGPKFPDLAGHASKHGATNVNAYYNAAVRNLESGKRFNFRHDGQFKDAFVTRTGPDSFTFTSASKNGDTIFTHFDGASTQYLRNLGITLPKGF